MPRKRNTLLDDSDLDSSSNSSDDDHDPVDDRDLQAEQDLFNDPYQHKRGKRRRKNDGEADKIYGVFADQQSEHPQNSSRKPDKRFQRAQVFVQASSSSANVNDNSKPPPKNSQQEIEISSDDDSESIESDADSSVVELENDPPSENQDDSIINLDPPILNAATRPGLGASAGLGSSASNNDFRAMLGANTSSQRAGLGLGFKAPVVSTVDPQPAVDQNEAEPSITRRSFLGAQQSDPAPKPAAKKALSKAEQAHFAKLAHDKTASIGLKMLQKMGWKAGSGLGTQGEGIVTPLETKARPKGMGLSYKGFEERTNQAKEEDRRNGKLVEEDQGSSSTKQPKERRAGREAWKAKAKAPKKPKIVHRTYEQIISDLTDDSNNAGIDPGVGEIIDLTGRKLPSLNTTLSHHSKGPTEEEKDRRLPELMHNLALICDMAKGNLIHLAKEGQIIKQKQAQLHKDQARSEELMKAQQLKLRNIKRIVELSQQTKVIHLEILDSITEHTRAAEICAMISRFDEPFYELMGFLQDEQTSEYESLKLDEIVVCALAPILRKLWTSWDVLAQPQLTVHELKRYKKCFRLDYDLPTLQSQPEHDEFQHPLFKRSYNQSSQSPNNRKMSAFESLIWNDWLPKIRSTVNNWSPYRCDEMIAVYTTWKPILPQFVHDNFLDQLIVPKLISSIESWDFRERPEELHSIRQGSMRVSLHLFVFPWLEHLGPFRSELLLAEVKMKLAVWLKSWKYTSAESAEEGLMIQDLLVWKQDVLKRRDWDKLILKTVAPSLSTYLRANLVINPKKQELRPFQVLLDWCRLISNQEMLTQLFTAEFFAKWMETLWIWLASPTANGEQIAQWYNWWRSLFPEKLLHEASVINLGFARAQELMNEAQTLGSLGVDLKTKLPRPDLVTRPLVCSRTERRAAKQQARLSKPTRLEEVTFRSVVEEEAAKMNMVVIPLGKSLESNGLSLFRVSNEFNGKTGLTISITDDVVYVKQKNENGEEEWEPMLVEEMLKLAAGSGN